MSSSQTGKGDSSKPTRGLSLMPSTSVVSGMGHLTHGSKARDTVLPPGTCLGEFEITDLVGEGGFGIVYLAYDHILQRKVAIKEYMPASLASRAEDGASIHPTSDRTAEAFQKGLLSFINEARLLARFDHPSMVKVFRFWEGNGTAYMAMPFYDGPSLRQILQEQDVPPDEAWLMEIVRPLLDALEILHEAQCFHRDIAPDNIIVLGNHQPVLLDFGAARRVLGESAQALTVILKPGYAPIEQYADVAQMRQGAWTDLYALASVVYFAIHGKPPPTSVTRMISDPLQPLATTAAGRYSEQFLHAFDAALAVLPDQRPQSVAEMRVLLGIPPRSTATAHSGEPRPGGPRTALDPERTVQLGTLSRAAPTRAEPSSAPPVSAAPPTQVAAATPVSPAPVSPAPLAPAAVATPVSAPAPAPAPATAAPHQGTRGNAFGLIGAGLVILALIAAAAVYLTRSGEPPAPAPQPAPATQPPAPVQAPTQAPAPQPAPAPESPPAPAVQTVQPAPPTPAAPEQPKAPPAEAAPVKGEPAPPPTSTRPAEKPVEKAAGKAPEKSPEKPSEKAPPGKPPVTTRPAATEAHKPAGRTPASSADEKGATPEADRTPKPQTARKSSRCSDLLHRITLGETLTPEDDNVMKRECR